MTQTNWKPAHMPTMTPYLVVEDSQKSLDFYQKAFGFELASEPVKENGIVKHAELKFLDTYLMLGMQGNCAKTVKTPKQLGAEPALSMYVYCKDVDAWFKNAIAHGAEAIMPPDTMFWGDRMCRVRDIDGFDWSFASSVQK